MRSWYRRLADVPGVEYPGSPDVDRSKLRWTNLEPEVHERVRIPDLPLLDSDYDDYEWEYGDEASSQSPASRHWEEKGDASPSVASKVARALGEALELPGTLKDYHFVIMGAAAYLESIARTDPTVLTLVEEWCLLDLRVVCLDPTLFSYRAQDGEIRQYRVPACAILARLYRSEGALREWLAVEEQSETLTQGDPERVRSLIAELEGGVG